VTGGNSSIGSIRFVRLQCRTCGRFMPHNGAWDGISALVPGLPGATGEGVMVRRLSLASLDSGAESPVYVGVPSAPAGHGTHPNGDVSQGGAGDCRATVDHMRPRQVATAPAATRRKPRHVGHRPAKRKMVCKGHPCIHAADGNPMTWFTSSLAVPRGHCGRRSLRIAARPRRLRERTDVHGREG
jgi:hypothetical protein